MNKVVVVVVVANLFFTSCEKELLKYDEIETLSVDKGIDRPGDQGEPCDKNIEQDDDDDIDG